MTKPIDIESLALDYNTSNSRLLFIDYDKTRAQFEASAKVVQWDADIIEILRITSSDRKNQVIMISGKDREYLEKSFGDLPIVMVAEHGAFYKEPIGNWNEKFMASNEWIKNVLPAFKALSFHYEGSYLEIKSYSLVWHYHGIVNTVSKSDKRQILAAIRSLNVNNSFEIFDGDFEIELRTPKISKGSFAMQWLGTRNFDFVMAIGDCQTDEDLFSVLGQKSYTIKIGQAGNSSAAFHLNTAMDVIPFFQSLLFANREFERMKSGIGLEY